ncbi:MAG: DNA-deoxyinosine glycosylase [Sarcina sp.]
MNNIKHTFEAIFNANSKVLILGTLPSVKSREVDFYYGHPQNRFWKVIAAITREENYSTIEEKKKMLLDNNIAIWDTISSCDIVGSSDSSIANVIPVDLSIILEKCDIKKIYVNGGKAYELYNKYLLNKTGIEAIKLPSTSPANARWNLEKLIDEWSILKEDIIKKN